MKELRCKPETRVRREADGKVYLSGWRTPEGLAGGHGASEFREQKLLYRNRGRAVLLRESWKLEPRTSSYASKQASVQEMTEWWLVHIPVLRTCEYVVLHVKRVFADVIKGRVLEQGD